MMVITTMPVGRVDTNCYILYHNSKLDGILIDPGCEADRILARIRTQGFKIKGIFLTHGHFDHIAAADELAQELGVKIHCASAEAELASDPMLNGSQLLLGRNIICTPHVLLEDAQVVNMGWLKVHAMLTPGHTAGHMCYYILQSDTLFSGDLLFKGSYGRHDLPTSNFDDLKRSMARLFALPPRTQVYPGHGEPTTIDREKDYNPILRE